MGDKKKRGIVLCGVDSIRKTFFHRLFFELNPALFRFACSSSAEVPSTFAEALQLIQTASITGVTLIAYDLDLVVNNRITCTILNESSIFGLQSPDLRDLVKRDPHAIDLAIVVVRPHTVLAPEEEGALKTQCGLLAESQVPYVLVCVTATDTVPSQHDFLQTRELMLHVMRESGWEGQEARIVFLPVATESGDGFRVPVSPPLVAAVNVGFQCVQITCVADCLEHLTGQRTIRKDLPLRFRVLCIVRAKKGSRDALVAGRVEQGAFSEGDQVVVANRHTPENPCCGTVHLSLTPDPSSSVLVKGLQLTNWPQVGDCLTHSNM